MTKIILLTAILATLSGCATTPREANPHCDQLATYARGMATLKQAGVPLSAIGSFTLTPVVATFPIKMIQQEVYSKDFKTPADAYAAYYNICTEVGYTNMR